MHFALEYRGDAETAAQYLAVQEEYFRNGGSKEIGDAVETLQKYKQGKSNFENRIISFSFTGSICFTPKQQ